MRNNMKTYEDGRYEVEFRCKQRVPGFANRYRVRDTHLDKNASIPADSEEEAYLSAKSHWANAKTAKEASKETDSGG